MLAILSCLLIAFRRGRFSGTTLIAPSRWAVFSLLLLGVVELLPWFVALSESTTRALYYVAATAAFCPLMAVLGAKRPQNIGWQFIVVSLWGVFVLPVGEMLVLWQGAELDEGPARRWFAVILLGVGLTNYALTKFGSAALLATVGQTLLSLPHLPFRIADWPWHFSMGNLCIALAVLYAFFQTRSGHTPPETDLSQDADNWNGVWRDFRDAFGMVWSLRVMERVNATGKLCNWSDELTWFGFGKSEPIPEEESEERERTMRTLLRRFVSSDWIDQRKNVSHSQPG